MTSAVRRFFQRLRLWHGGPVALLIGTALVAAGLLQTTTATQTLGCPTGTVLISKFDFVHNRYQFDKPDGNENVVRIANGSAHGGDWTSTIAVKAIVVKGGPAAVVTWFDPPQKSGKFTGGNLPDVGAGNTPDISNVQFCGEGSTGTTTTSTTTTPPTTTSTTTTIPSTTTSTTTTSTTTRPTTTSTTTTSTTTTSTTTTVPSTTTSTTTTSTTLPTTTTSTTTLPTTTTSTTTLPTSTTVSSTTGSTTTVPSSTTSTTTAPTTTANFVTSTSVAVLGVGVQAPNGTSLPRTGAPSIPMVVLGIVLMAIGATLTVVGRARDRRRI